MNQCICGSIHHIDVGDGIWSGTYRWYASYRCNKCGKNTEIDGCDIDSLPEDIKTLIIKREGEWGLRSSASKVKIKYLIYRILESKNIDFVEGFFFRGTRSQVEWVKNKLIEKGIVADDLVSQKL